MPGSASRPGARLLLLAAAVLLGAAVLWLARGRLVSPGSPLESPDTQIRRALAARERARLDDLLGPGAGGTAELFPVRYREIASAVEGDRATVVALVDGEGRVAWGDQAAAVSYLGRERFHLRPCREAAWCAEEDELGRLRGVLRLLLRRLDAEAASDPSALAELVSPRYRDAAQDRAGLLARLARERRSASPAHRRITAWQVRVDREGAEVGEDYALEAATGGGPRRLRARYTLTLEGERWLILAGL